MVIIVTGVTGSGKTTIGRALSEKLGWTFVEGDDYHSPSNKAKMSRGVPLTDADRRPWLEALRDVVLAQIRSGDNAVLACSALKRPYRDLLNPGEGVTFVYLKCDRSLLEERLRNRTGHFAGLSLLNSQFEALEEPGDSEPAITVIETGTVSAITDEIVARLGLASKGE